MYFYAIVGKKCLLLIKSRWGGGGGGGLFERVAGEF